MGGDASIFSVTVLDASNERRILLVIIEAREGEYNTVIKVCSRFLANAQRVVQAQAWNDQVYAEFTEVLVRVHILFRTAKRHDMLGVLTAPKRASAAEALMICEQVFRMLLDQEYSRASHLLEMLSDLLPSLKDIESSIATKTLVAQTEHDSLAVGGEELV